MSRRGNEFVQIYLPLLYRMARRKGLQHADAEELGQEVLVAVSRAVHRWQPDPAAGPVSRLAVSDRAEHDHQFLDAAEVPSYRQRQERRNADAARASGDRWR